MQTNVQLNYSSQFKTKVVLELLLSEICIQDLSDKYQVSVSSICRWKKQLVSNASAIFSTKIFFAKEEKEIKVLQKKRDTLLESINNLQSEKIQFREKEQYSSIAKNHRQHFILPIINESQEKNVYFRLIS